MMKRLVTLTVMLALLLCAAALAAVSGDYTYEVLDDGTARITKYTAPLHTLTYPAR